MAVKNLGKDFSICRNGGSFASPVHIPLVAARNIKVANKPAAMVNSTDRTSASTIITATEIPTRRSLELSFDMMWNGGVGAGALRTAFLTGLPIELAAFNAIPGLGGVGYRGDWLVKKFPLKLPLNDGQMIDISLVPHGNYTNAVTTYTDATGVPGTAEVTSLKRLGGNGSVNDNSNIPISAVRDFSFSAEVEVAKSSDRGSVFDTEIPVMRKLTAELEFFWEELNPQLVEFRTAWELGLPIGLSFLDGPYATSGSWGLWGDWAISDHPLDANLNDGQMCKIKLIPHGNSTVQVVFIVT